MSPQESWWRRRAQGLRAEAPVWDRSRDWLDQQAREADHNADVLALKDFDLSDLFRPTPGDALLLRGDL